jgi:hypothetical protein
MWDAALRVEYTQHASPQHLRQRQPHDRSVADTLIAASTVLASRVPGA